MAAVGVAEAAGGFVVFAKEQCGERAIRRVLAEELIDRAQKTLWVVAFDGALAAEIGLQIGHEQRCGDAFAGNIADDEAQSIAAEAEKVIIVAADLTGLMTDAGILERGELRKSLRKQARLDLLGDFDFLGGAAFGFEALSLDPSLGFDGVGNFIEADQGEDVAVGIAEAAEDTAPDGRWGAGRLAFAGIARLDADAVLKAFKARIARELHATSDPFTKFTGNIFGHERDVRVAANELEFDGIACGRGECEIGVAVGRGNDGPRPAGAVAGIKDELEAKGLGVKENAALEVAYEDSDGLEAKERGVDWKI